MTTTAVTNEMLYDLIMDLKSEFSEIKSDVSSLKSDTSSLKSALLALKSELTTFKEETYRHFELIDKRFEVIEHRLDRIEAQQMEDRKLLMGLWERREKVTVNFSRAFAIGNSLVSAVIAVIVSFFVQK